MQLGMSGKANSRALTSRINILSFAYVLIPESIVVLKKIRLSETAITRAKSSCLCGQWFWALNIQP